MALLPLSWGRGILSLVELQCLSVPMDFRLGVGRVPKIGT